MNLLWPLWNYLNKEKQNELSRNSKLWRRQRLMLDWICRLATVWKKDSYRRVTRLSNRCGLMTNLLIWVKLGSRTTSMKSITGLWTTQIVVALCSLSKFSSTLRLNTKKDFISQGWAGVLSRQINHTCKRPATLMSTWVALTRMKVSCRQVISSCPKVLITSRQKLICRSMNPRWQVTALTLDSLKRAVISVGLLSQSKISKNTNQINFHQLKTNNSISLEYLQHYIKAMLKTISN